MPENIPLRELLPLPFLTPGRRRVALDHMSEAASAIPEAAPLLALIPAAIALQQDATAVANRWASVKDDRAIHGDGAVEIHQQLTKVVTAMCGTLQGFLEFPDDDVVALARDVLSQFYPNGSGGQSSLPYVDQRHQNELFLTEIVKPEYTEHVARLGIREHVTVLQRIVPQFAAKLSRSPTVSYTDAQAAEIKAEAAFLGVYCVALGLFSAEDEPTISHRTALVRPILDQVGQQRALRAAKRARNALDLLRPDATIPPLEEIGRDPAGLAESVALDQELAASPPPAAAPAASTPAEPVAPTAAPAAEPAAPVEPPTTAAPAAT